MVLLAGAEPAIGTSPPAGMRAFLPTRFGQPLPFSRMPLICHTGIHIFSG
jgi:hypothetical protein